jgi:dipeptidyl aminopeptidase/acylaminoacyl peptidase
MRSTCAAFALVTALGAGSVLGAQDDAGAAREAMYRRYLDFPKLIQGGTIEPQWMADGTSFWYADGPPDRPVFRWVRSGAGKPEPIFDAARLRAALLKEIGFRPEGDGLPFPTFAFADGERAVRFEVNGIGLRLDLDTYAIARLPRAADTGPLEEWKRPRLVRLPTYNDEPPYFEIPSEDGRWFLSDKDNDLWIRSAFDDQARRLTRNGEADRPWDFAEAQWSPDSRRVAARRLDRQGLPLSPLVHWTGRKEIVEWWFYPDPGDPLPQTSIAIVDLEGGRQVDVALPEERDAESVPLEWTPDGKEVLIVRQDRRFKRLELLAANAETGAVRLILREERPRTFVEFKGFRMLPQSGRFLWISERDGWSHIYLYDLRGRGRQVTKGSFPVLDIVAVDEKSEVIFFRAHAEPRLYDTHLYRIGFDGRGFRRLTEGTGEHAIRFAPSNAWFIDVHSSLDRPPATELRRPDGQLVGVLARADVAALETLRWSPPEEFSVKAADRTTDLHGVLFKPHDFDPVKKYPVIDHIYGGPQVAWVSRTFDEMPHGVQPQALAQMGFIVFSVDARGTPERSKAFQDVVYGNLGRNEIPDHVAALRGLAATRPYMDLGRVGIYGNSWGGYFALRALLVEPEVYRAAVAGAPVSDVTQYIGHERYLGLPADNPEAYRFGSNSALAGNLAGNLLITIGTSDRNVRFAFPMQMVESLIRAGKFFDLIVMPGRDHHYGYRNETRPWQDRDYFIEAIRRHFVKHLAP